MKILTSEQTRKLDELTIKNEPIPSIELMERAARQCTEWLDDHFDLPYQFTILCGPGNNGGDGLAIARQLAGLGREVRVFATLDTGSEDNRANFQRLSETPVSISELSSLNTSELQPTDVIIDALFGSGLTRPLTGIYADIAEALDECDCMAVGIDIPSGLYADRISTGPSVKCLFTLSFQTPKLAFFMPENQDAVGEWIILDIGLDRSALSSMTTPFTTTQIEDIGGLLPVRHKFDHKGTYGHAFLIAGSFGKIGAAILAARAALRSGTGLLTVHVPRQATTVMHVAVPEAMISSDRHDYNFSGVDTPPKTTATGIGCGLGLHGCTTSGIRDLLRNNSTPLVIDADGLNTISANPDFLDLLPAGTILTPHLKEFARLFGETSNHFERIELARKKATEYHLVIVLKGAHTAVVMPDSSVSFNTTGNPGMATAGSGDVLTGIITGLLAQGVSPSSAACAGVFIHGLAGDIAVTETGSEALLASDIVDHIGHAFQAIRGI